MLTCKEFLKSRAWDPLRLALCEHMNKHHGGPNPFKTMNDNDPLILECGDCGHVAGPVLFDGGFYCVGCGGDLCSSIRHFVERSSQRRKVEALGCDAFSPAACRAYNLQRARDTFHKADERIGFLESLPELSGVAS